MRHMTRLATRSKRGPVLGALSTLLIGYRLNGGGWVKITDFGATVETGVGSGYNTYDSIFVNDKITTVGYNGNNTDIWNSTDGVVYTRAQNAIYVGGSTQPYQGSNELKSVAYGNGVYVALAKSNYILYSYDAVVWRQIANPLAAGVSTRIMSVCFGNGRFIAIGQDDRIITSTDGISWTVIVMGKPLGYLSYYGGKWHGSGGNRSAADYYNRWKSDINGVNWINDGGLTGPLYNTNVVYSKGRYIRVRSDGAVDKSSDGVEWSIRGYSIPAPSTRLVAKGDAVAYGTANGYLVYSNDGGETWTQRFIAAGANFGSVLLV